MGLGLAFLTSWAKLHIASLCPLLSSSWKISVVLLVSVSGLESRHWGAAEAEKCKKMRVTLPVLSVLQTVLQHAAEALADKTKGSRIAEKREGESTRWTSTEPSRYGAPAYSNAPAISVPKGAAGMGEPFS